MANLANLKADFNSGGSHEIYTNGEQAITGERLNYVLNNIVNTLGDGYRFKGIVTPESTAPSTDNKVFVVASEAGIYTNFGGLTVAEGELAFLYYDTEWHKGAAVISTEHPVDVANSSRDADLDISDESGHALVVFENGHIRTKNFDSEKVADITKDVTVSYTKDDLTVYRVQTSSSSESSTGTRLRCVIPIKKGFCIKTQSSYGSGICVAVYDSLANALLAGAGAAQGLLQAIAMAYTTAQVTDTIHQDGYLSISLKKTDGTAITDAEKASMIQALTFEASQSFRYLDGELLSPESVGVGSLNEETQKILSDGEKIITFDKSNLDIHQVNTSSTVETPSGTRLRILINVRKNDSITIYSADGTGGGIYANTNDALFADTSRCLQLYSSSYSANEFNFVASVDGILSISMKNASGTSISAEQKASLISGLTFDMQRSAQGWISRRLDDVSFNNIILARAAQKYFAHSASPLNNLEQYATIVHITDIHGDWVRVRRSATVAKMLGASLISTGDIVMYNSSDENLGYMDAIAGAGTYIHCVGNHDVWDYTDAQAHDRWITPFSGWGWTVPNGDNVVWFYKDDSAKKIRYISIDQFTSSSASRHYNRKWGQSQINWIISTLASTPAGYGVVVLMHSPELAPVKDDANDKFYQSYIWPDSCPITIQPLRAIVDAFIGKTTLNTTLTSPQETLSLVADFTNVASNEFICYITGHLHCDAISYVAGASHMQLLLNETCTNAWVNKTTSGAEGTSYPYFTEISDLPRSEYGLIQDCFNVYVIDRNNHCVRVVRIGSDCNKDFIKRDFMTVNYK